MATTTKHKQAGGAELIAVERQRQIEEEGYAPDFDQRWEADELAVAAACYAMPEALYVERRGAGHVRFVDPWPFRQGADKRNRNANYPNAIPTEGPERVQMLIRAGAFIAAEIDRLTQQDKETS